VPHTCAFTPAGVDSVLPAVPFGHFSTSHSNDTNKVINTPCTSLPCSPVFAKLQRGVFPSSCCRRLSRARLSLLFATHTDSTSCKSFPCHSYENTGGVYQLFPFWFTQSGLGEGNSSLPCPFSNCSISCRPSHFSSTAYKMLLPQLLCFDNDPFSGGVYPSYHFIFRSLPESALRERTNCALLRNKPFTCHTVAPKESTGAHFMGVGG